MLCIAYIGPDSRYSQAPHSGHCHAPSGFLTDRVIGWEPVPHFRAFIDYGVQLNHLAGLTHVRAAAAADHTAQTYKMVIPQRGIWGTASVDGSNIDRCAPVQCSMDHAQ